MMDENDYSLGISLANDVAQKIIETEDVFHLEGAIALVTGKSHEFRKGFIAQLGEFIIKGLGFNDTECPL